MEKQNLAREEWANRMWKKTGSGKTPNKLFLLLSFYGILRLKNSQSCTRMNSRGCEIEMEWEKRFKEVVR